MKYYFPRHVDNRHGVNIIRSPKHSLQNNSQLSILERMSAQDSQVNSQTNDGSRNNKPKVTCASSQGFRPCSELLESRCDNAEMCDIHNHRRLVRSQSESSFSLLAWRNCSWNTDQVTLQDLHCDSNRAMKEWRLPSIPQRDNNTAGKVKEFAPVTSTTPRRRSLCALPDLSKGAKKRVRFRASTPLTKNQVEKVNSTFDSLESKSQNLVNWLRDQQ